MKNLVSKLVLVACLLASTSPLYAGDLLLGAGGKSNYQIIIPDKQADEKIEASLHDAAELMKSAFNAQGVLLEIHPESEAVADKPGIYLGKTKFAVKNGIAFDKMKGWTYTFKAVGKNVIIAGNDQPDPLPSEVRFRAAKKQGVPFLATLKGTTEFMYKYLGARFLTPDKDDIEYMPTPIMFVSDNLDLIRRPFAQRTNVVRGASIYEVANGFEPMPRVFSHYGHYHVTAINPKEYAKTHPEYFIYAGGKRQAGGNHYCFSNPAVRGSNPFQGASLNRHK